MHASPYIQHHGFKDRSTSIHSLRPDSLLTLNIKHQTCSPGSRHVSISRPDPGQISHRRRGVPSREILPIVYTHQPACSGGIPRLPYHHRGILQANWQFSNNQQHNSLSRDPGLPTHEARPQGSKQGAQQSAPQLTLAVFFLLVGSNDVTSYATRLLPCHI